MSVQVPFEPILSYQLHLLAFAFLVLQNLGKGVLLLFSIRIFNSNETWPNTTLFKCENIDIRDSYINLIMSDYVIIIISFRANLNFG